MLSVALIWGINVPVMKLALAEMHAFAFNLMRLTLSCALLGVMVRLEHTKRRESWPPRTMWPRLVAIGLAGGAFYQLVFITGVWHTSAGNTGIILATAPIWTAIIGHLSRIERNRPATWTGLGIAFVGALLVILNGGRASLAGGTVAGNLLVLVSAMLWGLFTVMNKPLMTHVSPTRLAFFGALVSLPFHVAFAWPHLSEVRAGLSPLIWGCIVFSGLFSTGFAYVLWNYGIHHTGPSATAVYSNLIPFITLATSALLLAEPITPWQIAGGVLVLLGIVVLQRTRVRVRRPAPV